MPIYYRADTRDPETIFKQGFSPSRSRSTLSRIEYEVEDKRKNKASPEEINTWIQNEFNKGVGVKFNLDLNVVSEADPDHVVCLSKKLISTPMFPVIGYNHFTRSNVDQRTIYIYAIDLPADQPVCDLHARQIEQVKKIKDRTIKDEDFNTGHTAIGLCGYEVYTWKVERENIVAAVECTRSAHKPLTAGLKIYPGNGGYFQRLDREFFIKPKLFSNYNCSSAKEVKDNVREEFKSQCNKKLVTTSIADAIKDANLPDPKAQNLFLYCLQHGLIKDAIMAIFRSIYYGIKSAFEGLYQSTFTSINDDFNEITVMQEIDDDHDLMQEYNNIIDPSLISKSPTITHMHNKQAANDNSLEQKASVKEIVSSDYIPDEVLAKKNDCSQ